MDHAVVAWAEGIPIVTRCWAVAIFATSVLLSADVVDPVKLIFLPDAITKKWELWRLITPFLYFGPLNINVIFQLYNITQHSCHLEEGYTSPWLYLWLIFINVTLLLLLAQWHGEPALLSVSLLDALMYHWGRKNPNMQLAILGVISFPASYYALLCLAQSFFYKQGLGFSDLAGLIVGHIVFYFEDVFEKIHGFNPLQAPWLWFERPIVPFEVDEDPTGVQPAQRGDIPPAAEPDRVVENIQHEADEDMMLIE